MNTPANKTKNFSLFLCSFMWNIESWLIQKSSRCNYTFRRVRKVPKSHHQLRHVLSISPHGTTRPPLDGVFWILGFGDFFRKPVDGIEVSLKSDKSNLYFTWKRSLYTFIIIIFRQSILKMKNVSDGSCRGNQNTTFPFNNLFKKCAVYEIMWKNVV